MLEFTPVLLNQDQYCYNVHHFSVTAVAVAGVTEVDCLAHLDDAVHTAYKGLLATNCSYHGAKIQVIKPNRLDPAFRTTRQGAGTIAGDAMPPQVAGVVNLKTGLASRATRGRFYLPASSEADNAATAVPSAGYLTAVNTLCNALFTIGNVVVGGFTLTLDWVLYSRSLNDDFGIIQYTPRTRWGTMRSRSRIKHADSAPF